LIFYNAFTMITLVCTCVFLIVIIMWSIIQFMCPMNIIRSKAYYNKSGNNSWISHSKLFHFPRWPLLGASNFNRIKLIAIEKPLGPRPRHKMPMRMNQMKWANWLKTDWNSVMSKFSHILGSKEMFCNAISLVCCLKGVLVEFQRIFLSSSFTIQ